eukprot:4603133-Amphidinium_carterae.1
MDTGSALVPATGKEQKFQDNARLHELNNRVGRKVARNECSRWSIHFFVKRELLFLFLFKGPMQNKVMQRTEDVSSAVREEICKQFKTKHAYQGQKGYGKVRAVQKCGGEENLQAFLALASIDEGDCTLINGRYYFKMEEVGECIGVELSKSAKRTTTSMADTDYDHVQKLVESFGWKLTTSNKAIEDLDPSTVVPQENGLRPVYFDEVWEQLEKVCCDLKSVLKVAESLLEKGREDSQPVSDTFSKSYNGLDSAWKAGSAIEADWAYSLKTKCKRATGKSLTKGQADQAVVETAKIAQNLMDTAKTFRGHTMSSIVLPPCCVWQALACCQEREVKASSNGVQGLASQCSLCLVA